MQPYRGFLFCRFIAFKIWSGKQGGNRISHVPLFFAIPPYLPNRYLHNDLQCLPLNGCTLTNKLQTSYDWRKAMENLSSFLGNKLDIMTIFLIEEGASIDRSNTI